VAGCVDKLIYKLTLTSLTYVLVYINKCIYFFSPSVSLLVFEVDVNLLINLSTLLRFALFIYNY